MILIQIILVVGIFYLLIRFLANPSSTNIRAWKKILGIIFTLLAVVVVLLPQTANDIAHSVGVGRGADLLLYVLTLAFIFVCLNLYLKSKQDERRYVELARQIALLDARLNHKPKKKSRHD